MIDNKFLNEDGSINAEAINKLPLEEYMDVVGQFTEGQYHEYLAKSPLNESHNAPKVIKTNAKIEEECEGINGISAIDFLNNLITE